MWCDIPTQIVGLRKWAADGTVLAIATFRREGADTSTLLLAEIFKVTGGKLREIRAVILNLPNGAGTGWSAAH